MKSSDRPVAVPVLWQTGFRPFFLAAGMWAVISIALWFGILNLGWRFNFVGLTPSLWHAHEMIFGFCLAVIAGFLLTAVPNWTGSNAVAGFSLALILLMWATARVLVLFAVESAMPYAALADMVFIASLFVVLAKPIIRKNQTRQVGILVKVLLLGASNLLFYMGAAGIIENGMHFGIYIGFYLIIALILTLGRRVIPGFIERRLQLSEPLRNYLSVDIASIVLFIGFLVVDVFMPLADYAAWVALALFAVHSIRIVGWYSSGIWSDPLLWVLYVSYLFLVSAFGFRAAYLFSPVFSPVLAAHLFAIGGIGLITCGMMSRVSLGHTGRNVFKAPKHIGVAFLLIGLSAIVRVYFPMFLPVNYLLWVSISQAFWVLGFGIFVYVYAPMLISPRVDNSPG